MPHSWQISVYPAADLSEQISTAAPKMTVRGVPAAAPEERFKRL
jgi:hypothetical protein